MVSALAVARATHVLHAVHERLQVVVAATCNSNVAWTSQFSASFKTLVLEQCDSEPNATKAAGTSSSVQYLTVRPNVGREAHAYLWYIFHYYERLHDYTIFLQSDAPRHLPVGHTLTAAVSRAIRFDFSFLALTGNVVPAGYKTHSVPLKTFCGLYRNFSLPPPDPGAPCKAWNSVTWAHFAAKRQAIQAHSVDAYRRLLALLEEPEAAYDAFGNGNGEPAIAGATVLERSWSLLFGCARPLGDECTYQPSDTHADLLRRCGWWKNTLYGTWLGTPQFENSSKLGCRSFHTFNSVRVESGSKGGMWARPPKIR